jgi:hypothetical protein
MNSDIGELIKLTVLSDISGILTIGYCTINILVSNERPK